MVEGDTDRYFFKAVLQELFPDLTQEIAVLDIGGKGNYTNWRAFFEGFGLAVYYIGDFDNVFSLKIGATPILEKRVRDEIENTLKQNKLDNLNDTQKASFRGLYNSLIEDADFLDKPKRTPWKNILDKFIEFIKISHKEITLEVKKSDDTIDTKIAALYPNQIYILKLGAIEEYTKTAKGLEGMIDFCESKLSEWLKTTDPEPAEVKSIRGWSR